ncbi:MAG: hypothetical protein FRX49_01424 [Trebouxia sp. A1-2]|nr:MAG: hypothetical protein FRX49_01424 [Trebouxia sp. A1-2]
MPLQQHKKFASSLSRLCTKMNCPLGASTMASGFNKIRFDNNEYRTVPKTEAKLSSSGSVSLTFTLHVSSRCPGRFRSLAARAGFLKTIVMNFCPLLILHKTIQINRFCY